MFCSALLGDSLRDLLHPSTPSKSISIREDATHGIVIRGVKEESRCDSYEAVMRALQRGSLNRITKTTNMNENSSRSHSIFTITLEQRQLDTKENSTNSNSNSNNNSNSNRGNNNNYTDHSSSRSSSNSKRRSSTTTSHTNTTMTTSSSSSGSGSGSGLLRSKFHLVDLAGSERVKKSGAEYRGKDGKFEESVNINKGLLALANVIQALSSATSILSEKHIPYRQSKLTRFLQDSLGGNSHTVFVACVSPAYRNLEETITTLKYAARARNIK